MPCLDTPHHFLFDFDGRTTASQAAALFRQVPHFARRSDSLRLRDGRTSPVQLAPPEHVTGHWVRLVVRSSGFDVLELKRNETELTAAPSVVREARAPTASKANAFLRAACAELPCVGLILSLPPESETSLIESAVAAVAAPNGPVPLLALRDASEEEPKEPNDFTEREALPSEQIQSVVRNGYGVLRACYEQGLARDPQLHGRVQVRFVIGLDGRVLRAVHDVSDLPDPAVVQCVAEAFKALRFPMPAGSLITVVYPLMLSPE